METATPLTKTVTQRAVEYKSNDRGHFDYGWLRTWHTFSFAHYYHPQRQGFGHLRVVNDDIIQSHTGFGQHPHKDMEIVTIPLKGTLTHQDSTGGREDIESGMVQVMSAGTGIVHSEMNDGDKPVELFQIWIEPRESNLLPRYDLARINSDDDHPLTLLVEPGPGNNGLWINQDAWFYLGQLTTGNSVDYRQHHPESGVFVMNIAGEIMVDNLPLDQRDALGLTGKESLNITASTSSKFLIIEIPLK